jgi:signal transduction histidine kinase
VTPRAGGRAEVSDWAIRIPSILVVTALLALLVVPLLVQNRVDDLRVDIEEAAEPAQALLAEAQYLLARQSSALSAFIIVGEQAYLDEFVGFAERERDIYGELERVASRLGPTALARVVELRTLSDQWHRRLDLGTGQPGEGDLETRLERDLYLASLTAAGSAEVEIRQAGIERREEIRRVERFAGAVTLLLLLLALAAAVAVMNLAKKIRRLAAESEERRAEVEVALKETARATEARTSLIRGFTHDVKNPLGAADGHAELLEMGIRGELTTTQAETVGRIRHSIGVALEIIDQLLELSALERGGLQLQREPVDVHHLAGEVIRHHSAAADAAGVELTLLPPPPGDGSSVFTDPARVRQVIGNLVGNAIKYTPGPGTVTLSVRSDPQDQPPHPGRWVAVAVEDTGRGIPAEEMQRIFNEFHRVPGSEGRGHGLGLPISRRVARILGGDITVTSTLGRGSTFILWLPVREGS